MDADKLTIILAADHAGFELKESVRLFLQEKGYKIEDVGAFEYKEGDDYPEYMAKAARKIAANISGELKAILFGGSGQGEAMVVNRFPGVRAAVWYGNSGGASKNGSTAISDIVKLSREHNDANILSIGARFVNEDETKKAVELWLGTPFSGEENHKRRIAQIDSK